MENENIIQDYESIENSTVKINKGDNEYSTSNIDYISSDTGSTDSTNPRIYQEVPSNKLPEFESNSEVLSVSSGDLYGLYTVSANETVQNDYTPYMETINEHLEKIEKSLALIAFFIIFAWCSYKIVNAVRSFCGIGLK